MSLPLNGAAYTSNSSSQCPIHSDESDEENFHDFFNSWIVQQDRNLHELLSASETHSETKSSEEEERVFRPLIDRILNHYEEYYREKSKRSKEDVLTMLSPSWTSSLEDAFLWIGGWRPSMAFHLLYSKSGLQIESKLADIMKGLSTGNLGDLSSSQLSAADEMKRKTIAEERKITEKMAKHQETVADSSMVELSHIATELQNGEMEMERVDSALAPKQEGLQNVLERADDLRLRTLEGVIGILKPIQAVQFLIAAAELHLRIHEWGLRKDGAKNQVLNGTHHHTNGTRR